VSVAASIVPCAHERIQLTHTGLEISENYYTVQQKGPQL